MPEKILALLEKGSLTEIQLAEILDVSVDEVKSCMEYLQQAGFIRSQIINPKGSSCFGNCGKCTASCNEVSYSSFLIWEVI